MSRHPWKQIISDYYISGLAKCKFISQYHQTYPEVKLCRTSFYNRHCTPEKPVYRWDKACLAEKPLRSILPPINNIEVKPEVLEKAQKQSALPSPSNSSKFDAIVAHIPGGITIT